MRIGALLYIDNDISDNDLTFSKKYLPENLGDRIKPIEEITDIYYSIPHNYSGKLNNGKKSLKRAEKDDVSFWKTCFSETGLDHIVKIFCDSPFINAEIINEMIEAHTKYLAEFTYSENLPSGYSCEIISRELMESIPESNEKMLPLSDVIRSNINQFDVELYYKDPDIRDKRLSFRSGNPREKRIMENIYAKAGKIPEYHEVKEIIDNNPDVLYVCPSYVEIELSGRCDLECIFCYRKMLKDTHPDMDLGTYKQILNHMRSFELPYSICFGGSGEPMMHNSFYEILELAIKEAQIDKIVIETNGILADNNFKNFLLNVDNSKIKNIFNMNGMNEDTYAAIHKGDYFQTVFQNITSIKEAIPDNDNIYIQIMKINETEQFLDSYYDFWEKYNIPIILQKQNTYLSGIEDRRYSDLSPLERTPCWHLHRDINILSDGRISFCKQDVDGNFSRGSLANESLSEIWDKSREDFINNYNEKYQTNPDCKSCDEWYTFNL